MKVVCIKEIPIFNIKVGDKIDVNIESKYVNHEHSYYINRGINYDQEYSIKKSHFITLEEYREQQLNKIL